MVFPGSGATNYGVLRYWGEKATYWLIWIIPLLLVAVALVLPGITSKEVQCLRFPSSARQKATALLNRKCQDGTT